MFRLDAPLADGTSTLRKEYEAVARQTGIVPPELANVPQPPREIEYLFDWFGELSAARPSGFGISPIGYGDVDAWSRLTGRQLRAWEVRALRDLDSVYLMVRLEKKAHG